MMVHNHVPVLPVATEVAPHEDRGRSAVRTRLLPLPRGLRRLLRLPDEAVEVLGRLTEPASEGGELAGFLLQEAGPPLPVLEQLPHPADQGRPVGRPDPAHDLLGILVPDHESEDKAKGFGVQLGVLVSSDKSHYRKTLRTSPGTTAWCHFPDYLAQEFPRYLA